MLTSILGERQDFVVMRPTAFLMGTDRYIKDCSFLAMVFRLLTKQRLMLTVVCETTYTLGEEVGAEERQFRVKLGPSSFSVVSTSS